MTTILSVPLTNQLQVVWIAVRSIYEVREQLSKMYSWSALIASQITVKIALNIFGSSIFFLC